MAVSQQKFSKVHIYKYTPVPKLNMHNLRMFACQLSDVKWPQGWLYLFSVEFLIRGYHESVKLIWSDLTLGEKLECKEKCAYIVLWLIFKGT